MKLVGQDLCIHTPQSTSHLRQLMQVFLLFPKGEMRLFPARGRCRRAHIPSPLNWGPHLASVPRGKG